MRYAVLNNRTNAVALLVDWDGKAPIEKDDTWPQDHVMLRLVDLDAEPAIGATWNGSTFLDPPPPPAEPPAAEEAETSRGRSRRRDE